LARWKINAVTHVPIGRNTHELEDVMGGADF
jgi:hypothetical protein